MAYIAPNSTVQLFGNLNLSDNYHDSLYFASTSAKDTYFGGLTMLANKSALSYTREQRGYVRLEVSMASVISARYMRFKNTSFENKWFYAFVKNIEYINNNCTQINFELDPLMTWMGEFTLSQCFIERQHTVGDAIGANICGEKLECGEYVCEGSSQTAFFGSYYIGFYKTFNPDEDTFISNALSQGTYVPLIRNFYALTSNGVEGLQSIIDSVTEDNRIDEILTMKLVPEHYTDTTGNTPVTDQFSVEKPYTTIGASGNNYTPRNKKLYCYPYKYLEVENCEGDRKIYKYEYFETLPDATSSGSAYFQIMGTACTPEVSIMCTPKNYYGKQYDYANSLSMNRFPSVAFNVDMYKAYIAQRDSTLLGEMAGSIAVGALGGAIAGGAGGAMVGATTALVAGSPLRTVLADSTNELLGSAVPARMPHETRGQASSNVMVQSKTKNFYFRKMCITKNYAMMIDNYFDMFGYAIKQHGVPNMNARPNWTYVKTIGCDVGGAIPADDASAIEKIFDNGIRFWKNHSNIGNYSLNNAPA